MPDIAPAMAGAAVVAPPGSDVVAIPRHKQCRLRFTPIQHSILRILIWFSPNVDGGSFETKRLLYTINHMIATTGDKSRLVQGVHNSKFLS